MDENLVNRLRGLAGMIPQKHKLPSGADTVICSLEAFMQIKELAKDSADAIENLNRQRDRAYARLCEWCGVCPEGKRNAEDCEIAALNPEPQKDKAPAGPYDLLYEEGGPDTR